MSIQATIESKSRNGTGVKINGNWYNGSPQMLANINWKDEVNVTLDGKNVVDIEKVGGGSANSSSAQSSAPTVGNDNRQEAIMYQSSLKTAAEVVSAALAADILPLPAAKGAKYDAFLAAVEDYASELFTNCCDVAATGDVPSRSE